MRLLEIFPKYVWGLIEDLSAMEAPVFKLWRFFFSIFVLWLFLRFVLLF